MKNGGIVRQLSPTLFWDVDAGTVDAEAHRNFIIPRVMDRGSRDLNGRTWGDVKKTVLEGNRL